MYLWYFQRRSFLTKYKEIFMPFIECGMRFKGCIGILEHVLFSPGLKITAHKRFFKNIFIYLISKLTAKKSFKTKNPQM